MTDVWPPAVVLEDARVRLEPLTTSHAADLAIAVASGRAVGMTTFCRIHSATPRVEIGYTFSAGRLQRSDFNASCERLLLELAFESFGCVAVEFRTHALNHASRRAIERLGAKLDGARPTHPARI